MTKIIVINNLDGSCSIVHPAPEMFDPGSRTRQELSAKGINFLSEDEIMQYIFNKDIPADATARIADISILPTDREFRMAWTDALDTETVDIDINKAIEIRKNVLRGIREPLLKKLDIDYMKAGEINDEATRTAIIIKKQALRDMTNLEFPTNIEDLKIFCPACLEGV